MVQAAGGGQEKAAAGRALAAMRAPVNRIEAETARAAPGGSNVSRGFVDLDAD
jgi:hypothetical protein